MKIEKLETKFMARNVVYFKTIDSTQIFAKNSNISNTPNGTLIIADFQTNGVGTHGRKWYDVDKQNITMTIILYPNCNINKISGITKIIAECMIKVIKNLYGYTLSIKEPNDIIYNGKKIAGILTESNIKNETVEKLFIGIGLNVNQTMFAEEIINIATSLKKEFGKEINREEIIAEFFNIFEKEYIKIVAKSCQKGRG